MKTFMVALASVNTQAMQHIDLDLRMNWLEAAIAKSYEISMQRCKASGPLQYPFGLFVAPEYLFAYTSLSGSHNPGDRRHLDESEKELRLQRLKEISKLHKGMIMIPGTIAWQKNFLRTGAKQYHSKGLLAGQAKTVSRQQKAIDSVNFYANRQQLAPTDRLAGPLGATPAPTTQEKLNELAQVGPLINFSGAALARNTAYVLLDGEVLMKYNKQGDFHEVLNGNTAIHIPGKLDGRFQIKTTNPEERPIDFGLEICLDHVYQTTGKEIPHLGQVDIHVISSAQVQENRANLAMKTGGYLVHACSNAAYTGIKQLSSSFLFGSNLSGVTPFFKVPSFNGVPLQISEITLDLAKLTGSPQGEIAKRSFY